MKLTRHNVESWEELLGSDRWAAKQGRMCWYSPNWYRWLPPGSPAFAAFKDLDSKYNKTGLSRDDVFDATKKACSGDSQATMQFLMAVMLWGYSDLDGRGPFRVAKMTSGSDCAERVGAVLDSLKSGDLEKAYRQVRSRSFAGLPWLGPSYATKILYFGGYREPALHDQKPLILDAFVAKAFRHVDHPPMNFHPGWCWRNYEYLIKRVKKKSSADTSEEDIEYRLFELGKQLST